jgi:hypothetical protein
MFLAVKQHFSDGNYDYFKYNGKVRVNAEKFQSRKDRFQFEKIKRKMQDRPEDVLRYLVANLHDNPKAWIGQLTTSDAMEKYKKWQAYQESFTYNFTESLDAIRKHALDFSVVNHDRDLNGLLRSGGGKWPPLFEMYSNRFIPAETIIAFDRVFPGLFAKWDRDIEDTFMWPITHQYLAAYGHFLTIDRVKIKFVLQKEYLE